MKDVDWIRIGKKLKRNPRSVYDRWRTGLEPKLQKFHTGSQNDNLKRALIKHMVEHDLMFAQDVDWKELIKLPKFAGTTVRHLQNTHGEVRRQTKRLNPTLGNEELTSVELLRHLRNASRKDRRRSDYME